MRSLHGIAAALLFCGLGVSSQSQNSTGNWPQWRGPHLNGSSQSARNLPIEWSETQNVVWRTKLPSWAAATPIVWGDTVLVTSAEEGFSAKAGSRLLNRALNRIRSISSFPDDLLLLALDRKNGKERWRAVIGEGNYSINKQNMATPSPVTDGKHIWVMTGTGKLSCFDFQGKKIWQRDIVQDYGLFGLNWGYGSSPLLHNSRLYVQVLHGMKTDDPSYVLGIDAATGKTLWRVERPTDAIRETPDSYSTPMIAQADGKTLLVVCGAGYLTIHDIDSGKEVARAGGLDPNKERAYRTISSSVVVGDIIFAPSRRQPFIAFRLTDGAQPSLEQLWTTQYGPDVPTVTTDGQRVYIIDDRGIALCMNKTDGEIIWGRSRLEPGTYSASPVLADGKIYAINEEGMTTVIKAGGDFEILSVNKLNDYTLASPAVVGSHIFIRTANYLYCIGKTETAAD